MATTTIDGVLINAAMPNIN